MENNKSVFDTLNAIDVSKKIEKKNGLSYLSWAWAWSEVKKIYPLAQYKVYETNEGCIYWTDGKTAWVKTSVTINDLEHIEYLPVMDYKNQSIPLEKVTSFDVNKAIQRSLTKALARHGLGLYIYAGEDLPEPPKELNKKLLNECEKLTINLSRYAQYIGKAYSDLTDTDLENAIKAKKTGVVKE